MTGYRPGDVLSVTHPGDKLRAGEMVVVVDKERYPTKWGELVDNVGPTEAGKFICVEGCERVFGGFWYGLRFRKARMGVA